MTKEHLKWKRGVYKQHGMPKLNARVLKAGENRQGQTYNGVRYTVEGEVASGDADTWVGNTEIVGTHDIFIYERFGLVGVEVVAGDDSHYLQFRGPVPTPAMLQAVVEDFRKIGFMAEVDCTSSGEFWRVEFCSSRYWPALTADKRPTYVLGPKPGRVIAKLCMAKNKPKDLDATKRHVRAVALGVWSDVRFVPFLNKFVQRLLQLTAGVDAKPYVDPFRIHVRAGREFDEDPDWTPTWISELYGFGPTQVQEWDDYLQTVELTTAMSHPVLTRLMEVDN